MSDHPHHKQTLSEISHLFLSGVRDRAAGDLPRPTRIPPPKQDVSIDMTPEEFAGAFGAGGSAGSQDNSAQKIGPVSVLVVPHLGEEIVDGAKAYARHVAATRSERVGIIEVDACLFRLYSVERTLGSDDDAPVSDEGAYFEAHQLADALQEMSWDIDRWVVLLPNPRLPEARALLRQAGHWVLLCTADHDGMVAAYRSLKGLNDGHRPRLSIVVLGASERPEAGRLGQKLSGVCQQFLNWSVADCTSVPDEIPDVAAHVVLAWRPTHDKAAVAAGPHWRVVADFMHRAKAHVIDDTPTLSDEEAEFVAERIDPVVTAVSPAPVQEPAVWPVPVVEPMKLVESTPVPAPAPAAVAEEPAPASVLHTILPAAAAALPMDDGITEVIDLPDGDPSAILSAILKHHVGQLVECPVRPPACDDTRLAITRDRRIVLLAVARQGLADLGHVGKAYRWIVENRSLISMALPQFAIDPHQHPQLRLIVNHADLAADVLQPMLQSSTVTVHSYRKLRWGPKTGLLLQAA